MKTNSSLLTFFSLLLVINLIATFADAQDRHDYYCTNSTPVDLSSEVKNWMSKVPDDTRLSALSIPGTHDACSLYGGDMAQTQAWSLASQFEAGIRFVDIRCRRMGTGFTIHHGQVYQKITFGNVLNACKEFLSQNPSECIIMRVQEEYTPSSDAQGFPEIFNSYFVKDQSIWYNRPEIPTLSQVRGKIVLVTSKAGIGGINWNGLQVQDEWEVSTVFDIGKKWNQVLSLLGIANKENENTWFVNFTSGSSSSGGAYPYTIARDVNYRLYNYISTATFKRVGTIVMDFPGEKLISKIINLNFKATRQINGAPLTKNSRFYLENAQTHNYVTKWYAGSYYYPQYGQQANAEPLVFGNGVDNLTSGSQVLIKTENVSGMKSSWQSSNELTTFGNGVGYYNYGSGNGKALWILELENSSANGQQIYFNDIILIKNVEYSQYLYPYPGKNYLWTKNQADESTKWIIRSR